MITLKAETMPSILSLAFASACTSLSASEAKALCESIGRSGVIGLAAKCHVLSWKILTLHPDECASRGLLIVGSSGNPSPLTKTRWKRCQDLSPELLRMRHAVRDESQ